MNLKVALIQQKNSSNVVQNISKLKENIIKAAENEAKLICLSELHNTLYFCQQESCENFKYAETIPGYSTDLLSSVAKDCGVVVVSTLFEKRARGIYHNTSVVFDSDGSIAGLYRKMHIPDDPGFYEKFYFTPGDTGFYPIKTSIGKIGVLICWDQWYPEAARVMCLNGAEMLVYPTAIGWELSDSKEEKIRQLDAWITIQRSHAIANGVPVISINRVGFEENPLYNKGSDSKGIDFWGNSFVVGQQGEFLVRGDIDEDVLFTDINLAKTENIRQIWPFFRDRRIDAYDEILLRYNE